MLEVIDFLLDLVEPDHIACAARSLHLIEEVQAVAGSDPAACH